MDSILAMQVRCITHFHNNPDQYESFVSLSYSLNLNQWQLLHSMNRLVELSILEKKQIGNTVKYGYLKPIDLLA
jgi:hypothetical protein